MPLCKCAYNRVAPHAGAWIEIIIARNGFFQCRVAPHAGAWIEMLREGKNSWHDVVAPHAGAWIEICGLSSSSL